MIELLNSNFQPLKTANKTFPNVFFTLLSSAKSIKIASGYVSDDSIATLLGLYEREEYTAELNLIVGMGYFDSFPKSQFNALVSLGRVLRNGNFGNVFVAKVTRYHGKVYSFCNHQGNQFAIIGSSNLTKINAIEKIYDTDLLVHNEAINNEIEAFLTKLQNRFCVPIESLSEDDIKFREPDDLFFDYLGVEKLSPTELSEFVNAKTKTSFEIPIKPEAKSHLNCYFGKGRTMNGVTVPRDWYEVNIIVSKNITTLPNYPSNSNEFIVVTDDGYRFKCEANGDYSKNFRSSGDLKILGRWLKGRMEASGALKVGEYASEEVQKKYGRNSFTLTKTKILNTWYLDYGFKK